MSVRSPRRRTRFIPTVLAVAIAGGGIFAALQTGPGDNPQNVYRVDAIFDTAKGVIPGQLLKIAGARAGKIKDVELTPDYKARIVMEVEKRFAPFRENARCDIQPEGLISERFVQCDPGTADAPALKPRGADTPTVPVDRTAVPVSLNDLFNVWQTPVRQRFSVIVASLGLGVAARGDDLNEILRRANPTLGLVRKALRTLDDQREELSAAVKATDNVTRELARRDDRVADFIDQAARVSTQTGTHSRELAEGVRRLPSLLDALRPALRRADRLVTAGTPVLRDLRRSGPALDAAVRRLEPFARAGRPALRELIPVADQGRRTARSARATVDLLRQFAAKANPVGTLLNRVLVDLRDRGGIENLLLFGYHSTAGAARYDAVSHLLPSRLLVNDCVQYATAPTPGCSANYNTTTATTPRARRRAPRRRKPVTAPTQQQPEQQLPKAPLGKLPDRLPVKPVIKIPGLPPIELPPLPGVGGPKSSTRDPDDPLAAVLDYLLR